MLMGLTKKRPGAWGFIIRDNEGVAGSGNVSPLYDALMAETMACVKALEAANAQGISRIQIEAVFSS
jgi:ribonuclease HI